MPWGGRAAGGAHRPKGRKDSFKIQWNACTTLEGGHQDNESNDFGNIATRLISNLKEQVLNFFTFTMAGSVVATVRLQMFITQSPTPPLSYGSLGWSKSVSRRRYSVTASRVTVASLKYIIIETGRLFIIIIKIKPPIGPRQY